MRVSAPPTSGGINIIALYLPVGKIKGHPLP
nr:MAG TPA: hypothetical protein [Caudoviricetes sp.]